jgi:hypothetical protein
MCHFRTSYTNAGSLPREASFVAHLRNSMNGAQAKRGIPVSNFGVGYLPESSAMALRGSAASSADERLSWRPA